MARQELPLHILHLRSHLIQDSWIRLLNARESPGKGSIFIHIPWLIRTLGIAPPFPQILDLIFHPSRSAAIANSCAQELSCKRSTFLLVFLDLVSNLFDVEI